MQAAAYPADLSRPKSQKETLTLLRRLLPVFACCALAYAGDIKVVANPSVTASAISTEELKAVFLLTKASIAEGGHVEPVLVKGGPTHEAFLKEYVGKTDSALETYYRSLVFTGKASMPKSFASDADVVAFVAKT